MAVIKPGRRVGNTTRLADEYIQKLFDEGIILVVDHYHGDREHGSSNMGYIHLFDVIIRRMRFEHPTSRLDVNRDEYTIKLVRYGK